MEIFKTVMVSIDLTRIFDKFPSVVAPRNRKYLLPFESQIYQSKLRGLD